MNRLYNILAGIISPFGKTLWTGSFMGGTINVPEINDYILFAVKPELAETWMLAYRDPGNSNFRAFGGYVNATPNQFSYMFSATVSGTTMTYVKATNVNVTGTTHQEFAVGKIVGLIPNWGGVLHSSIFNALSHFFTCEGVAA